MWLRWYIVVSLYLSGEGEKSKMQKCQGVAPIFWVCGGCADQHNEGVRCFGGAKSTICDHEVKLT